MNVNLNRMRTRSRGFLFYPALVLLYLMYSNYINRRSKMNIITNYGKEVYFLLLENGFSLKMARYITAQAAHETGNFTSKIFKENNNLFGMKLALIRKTTATGEKYGHATYNSIEDSVKDFKIYYDNFKYMRDYSSIAVYVQALKRNKYFEDNQDNYTRGVELFYKKYFASGE